MAILTNNKKKLIMVNIEVFEVSYCNSVNQGNDQETYKEIQYILIIMMNAILYYYTYAIDVNVILLL